MTKGDVFRDVDGHDVDIVGGPNRFYQYFGLHKNVNRMVESTDKDGHPQTVKVQMDAIVVHEATGAAVGYDGFDIGPAGTKTKAKRR